MIYHTLIIMRTLVCKVFTVYLKEYRVEKDFLISLKVYIRLILQSKLLNTLFQIKKVNDKIITKKLIKNK